MIRYQGGKSRLRKYIVPILQQARLPGQMFIDLFVGGGWILEQMENPRIANDIDFELISLYSAIQGGWRPPSEVTEEHYHELMAGELHAYPYLHGFVAFGCSWGGKKWGGYARSETKAGRTRNYAKESRDACLSARPLLEGVQFTCMDYKDFFPPSNALVYADPPYAGTTGYAQGLGGYRTFMLKMMLWAAHGNTVFISERADYPSDFADLVWQQPYSGGIRSNDEKPAEKLYRVRRGGNTTFRLFSVEAFIDSLKEQNNGPA